MKNKIIERFEEKVKEELYNCLLEGKKVMFTTTINLATRIHLFQTIKNTTIPNSYISKDGMYTVGINPTDESYFHGEIKKITDLVSTDRIKIIKKFINICGKEEGKKAFNNSFETVREQYNFEDVIKLINK